MNVFRHPRRTPIDPPDRANWVVWALIAAVVALNLILMWRIATGGV